MRLLSTYRIPILALVGKFTLYQSPLFLEVSWKHKGHSIFL